MSDPIVCTARPKRIIVGISGASGVLMGYELLKALRVQPNVETHLVVSPSAQRNFELETDLNMEQVYELAGHVYDDQDMSAAIASGSYQTDGMIVIPCSMKTLSAIAVGYSGNLLVRAADVCLKEGRRVVLVARETPLSKIHLRNMQLAAEAGCTILPPMLTFYNGADTLQKQMEHIIGKVLLQFQLSSGHFVPWSGPSEAKRTKLIGLE